MDQGHVWMAVGFLGQALFSARFIIQWIYSEKMRRSVIPRAFWYFSLIGGVTLFAYALHKKDPVFIVGQGSGVFIYLRNIYFVMREKRSVAGHDPAHA
ncbi:MAG TPA: lipid-A-disaccharide synthase N-terminal domain-containing protein [Verrucomicrobiae bacterium]|nr:lipid-A-disaccharide synthase N-terminal domain-containing protein [Verrucomicrobiae bacterium]